MAYWINQSGNRYFWATGLQDKPAIVELASGTQFMAWIEFDSEGMGTVMGRIVNTPSGDGEVRTLSWPINVYAGVAVRLVATADGGFDAFWNESTPNDQFGPRLTSYMGRHFDANGDVLGEPFSVTSAMQPGNDQEFQAIGLASGNILVMWRGATSGSPTYRVITPDGIPLTDVHVIDPRVQANDNYAQTADVAATPDGGFYLAWNTFATGGQSHVYFQKFDASGVAQGDVHLAMNFESTDTIHVAALADGNAVITVSHTYPGGQTEIMAGEFTQAGHIAGFHGAQIVMPQGQLLGPHDVTALPDGGFFISWTEESAGAYNGKLWMQRYDSGFTQVDQAVSSFVGDTGISVFHDQIARSDGAPVFVWTWSNRTDAGDIHAVAYENAAVPGSAVNGTAGNDALAGTTGDDTVSGGAGLDTFSYPSDRAHYSISRTADAVTVLGYDATFMQTDWLRGVERLHFSDVNVALDVEGHAGQAYRLYQAAFDRGPDWQGLGYHIADLDRGTSLQTVAAHFLASPEFQSRYGSLDDEAFVTRLYANVLGRGPDAAGKAYHLNDLHNGVSRADVLTHFSESPENAAALVGVIENGMTYIAQ